MFAEMGRFCDNILFSKQKLENVWREVLRKYVCIFCHYLGVFENRLTGFFVSFLGVMHISQKVYIVCFSQKMENI